MRCRREILCWETERFARKLCDSCPEHALHEVDTYEVCRIWLHTCLVRIACEISCFFAFLRCLDEISCFFWLRNVHFDGVL
jgi:hypothetical protein